MRATAETKKNQLIADFIETRRAILDAAASLPSAAQDEVFLGVWSVKDLLAHLAGWDVANREAAEAVLAGRLPAFYAHHDHDWRTYNARLVAQYKQEDFAALLASVAETQGILVAYLQAIPAAEFDKDTGVRFKGYKVTVARLIQSEVKDEKTHCQQIVEFKNRHADADTR